MEKSIKIMLGIAAAFFVLFVAFLVNDYIQFHSHIDEIIMSLKSSEPSKLEAAWYSVVILRSFEFMVPCLIFGVGGLIMHFKESRVPKVK